MTDDEAALVAEIHRLTAFDHFPNAAVRTNQTSKIIMIPNATSIARRLILLQRDHVRARAAISPADPTVDDYELIHIALDVLGAPPEEEFCRDVWYGLFDQVVLDHDDVDRLIELMEYVAAGKPTGLLPAGRGLHEVVGHLYPEPEGAAR